MYHISSTHETDLLEKYDNCDLTRTKIDLRATWTHTHTTED